MNVEITRGDVAALLREHPNIAALAPPDLGDQLFAWRERVLDPRAWLRRVPKFSRGFWTDLLLGAAGFDRAAAQRLAEIDAGLGVAEQVKKRHEYRERLFTDDSGYVGCLAELAIVRRLAPGATRFDLAIPTGDGENDFDLQLEFAPDHKLAVEVKAREERILGATAPELDLDVEEWLGGPDGYRVRGRVTSNSPGEQERFEAALLIEAARAFSQSDEQKRWPVAIPHLRRRDFPSLLWAPTRQALANENSVVLFHVEDPECCAIYVDADERYYFDHEFLREVTLDPGGRGVSLNGPAESRPLLSRPARESYGRDNRSFDDPNPESGRLRDSLEKVGKQLPRTPYGIGCCVLFRDRQLGDLDLALYGEPFREGHRGGLFQDEAWGHISGVLAVNLDFATPAAVAHWRPNPRGTSLPELLQSSLLLPFDPPTG